MGDVEAALRRRLASLSLEQKARLLTGADFCSLHPEPAIGLRRLVLSDGLAGFAGCDPTSEDWTGPDHGPGSAGGSDPDLT
jgi:hypothetical protein